MSYFTEVFIKGIEFFTGSGESQARVTAEGELATNAAIRGDEFFGPYDADVHEVKVSHDGELATTVTERERNVLVHYQQFGIVADTYYVLVDLSDTIIWPHDQTGRIDVSHLNVTIEKSVANTVGEFELGVITRIDGTDADIDYLYGGQFLKNDAQYINQNMNFAPSQVKFDPSFYLTNSSETNVAAVNTGGTLASPGGNVTPAVGDVVIKASWTSGGNYDFDIELLYHGEEFPHL